MFEHFGRNIHYLFIEHFGPQIDGAAADSSLSTSVAYSSGKVFEYENEEMRLHRYGDDVFVIRKTTA